MKIKKNMYACVYMCVHVCVCACVYQHARVWRPEVNLRWLLQITLHLMFLFSFYIFVWVCAHTYYSMFSGGQYTHIYYYSMFSGGQRTTFSGQFTPLTIYTPWVNLGLPSLAISNFSPWTISLILCLTFWNLIFHSIWR